MGATIDLMLQIADRIESAIDTAMKQHEQQVADKIKHMPNDEAIVAVNDSAHETMLLMGPVTQFARKSMLIAAYSQFEDTVKQLCRIANKLGMNSQVVPQMRFFIQDARAFLLSTKSGQETFRSAAFGTAWDDVENGWRKIRNVLAHDDGLLAPNLYLEDPTTGELKPIGDQIKDAADIRAFVATRTCLGLFGDEIHLNRDAVETFLRELDAALEPVHQEFERLEPRWTKEERSR